jgi:hypothetical protein
MGGNEEKTQKAARRFCFHIQRSRVQVSIFLQCICHYRICLPPLISSVATAVKEPTPIPYSVNVLIIDFVGNEGESSWLYRRLLSLPALTHYCMPLCWWYRKSRRRFQREKMWRSHIHRFERVCECVVVLNRRVIAKQAGGKRGGGGIIKH